jgi:3-isopropylmalate/(R)-2-methylmalate dehydratase small subunit
MEPFRKLDTVAAALAVENIDTDQIIPARFMRAPRSTDHGQFLFHDMRRRPDGTEREDFPLNQHELARAGVLVADTNFGCGSSREAAVYALFDAGIRCVIAPSFGDIFYSNATKNGLLPVVLDRETVQSIWRTLEVANSARVEVDLEAQTVHLPDGTTHRFEIDPFKKRCLLEGLDDIDLTLGHSDEIVAHERAAADATPWAGTIG